MTRPPDRFAYRLIDRRFPGQWHVLPHPGGRTLGSVVRDDEPDADDPSWRPGWMASPCHDDAYTPGFTTRRAAAVWLWERVVDKLGHEALACQRMTEKPESPYAELVRRAGLTVSLASRILGINPRFGRRLISGEARSHPLTPENIAAFVPLAANPIALQNVEASAKAIALLWPLVVENEQALELERQGKPASRPLRHQAILRAQQQDEQAKQRRLAEGRTPSPRGTGMQRMVKEAERALRRVQAERGVAEITGEEQRVKARLELEQARAAKLRLLKAARKPKG